MIKLCKKLDMRQESLSANADNFLVLMPKNFKKQRSLPEIVGSLKTVGKIQQLVRKRSQKTNYDVTALAVYPIFNKLTFFATSIIFLESTIKLITGIFDSQK